MEIIVLLFGSALDRSRLEQAFQGTGELVPLESGADLRRALTSAEVLEQTHLLLLAPADRVELGQILEHAAYIDSQRTVCFSSFELYGDPGILGLRPRYVGVCDEHPSCVLDVARRICARHHRTDSGYAPMGGRAHAMGGE